MRQLPRNFHTHQHGMGAEPWPILLLPAYTVFPFVRVPVGHDLVLPGKALIHTGMLIVLPVVFWWFHTAFTNRLPPANAGHVWLVAFALAHLLASLIVFIKRSRGINGGEEIHKEEAGYSWLAWTTDLPVWLTEQLIVPACFIVLGWLIAQTFSLELGWWCIACGLSLLIMANWEFRRMRRAMLTTTAGMIQAQTSGWRVEQHEARAKAQSGGAGHHTPEFAEMGSGPADVPDAVSFARGNDGVAPDFMTWFRKRKPAGRSVAPRPGATEARDYADIP